MTDRMTLYFDGGSRPRATVRDAMEIAVVTGGQAYIRDAIGQGDNCTAEWLALRYAVEIALANGAQDALFVGDARTVVEQALGRWRCRSPQLQPPIVTRSPRSHECTSNTCRAPRTSRASRWRSGIPAERRSATSFRTCGNLGPVAR
jgi:ribonuclease HI